MNQYIKIADLFFISINKLKIHRNNLEIGNKIEHLCKRLKKEKYVPREIFSGH